VKTDRIDAAELAEFYANGLLTIVAEPHAEVEQDRDLLRSRQRLMQQQAIITEIGDVRRFPHPRQLVSWAGMDIREYASGGKSTRLGITRQGNRYLRTALIEANQRGYRSTVLGKDVKARRAKSPPEYVAIADRCLRRLNKKGNRLLLAGKHPNKVKVACGREMVGFIWESLNQAAVAQ